MDDVEKCSICYDALLATDLEAGETGDCMIGVKIQECGHLFCRGCLVEHCKHAIQSRDIPISCPAAPICRQKILEAQVEEILSDKAAADADDSKDGETSHGLRTNSTGTTASSLYLENFQRALKKILDPNLIECPKCAELFTKDMDSSCKHVNDLTCPSCQHFFCAVHGDAHPTTSCKMHESTMTTTTTSDIESEGIIRRLTKPCSHCGIAIYKESGCDHIICASCKQDMCFKCGSHEYLSGDMVRSCSKCNQGYVDHRQLWRFRLTLVIRLAIKIPVAILQMAVLLVIVVATCGCCFCMCCGYALENDHAENMNNTNDASSSSEFRPLTAIKEVTLLAFSPVIDVLPICLFACCGCEGVQDGTAGSGTHSEDDFEVFETDVSHDSLENTDNA